MENITINFVPEAVSEVPANLIGHAAPSSILKPSASQLGQQYLLYKLQQLGWQGILGASLILASILILFFVSLPKAQELQALQLKQAEQNLSAKQNIKLDVVDANFNVEQQFYALLPNKSQANSKITAILHAASANGLTTDKIDYAQSTSATSIVQYHVNLPAQGSYKQIRQFINQALNTLPSLALDEVSLRRDDITSEVLDARIQFTLYVQNDR